MSKIIFIEPKAPNLHIYSQFPLPRLGTFILATQMKLRGWQAEVIFEETEKIDFEEIRTADIVGISTITSTAPRAYLIADTVREMGIPVIMGGPHVSYLPDEALEHADFVIRGEGERALQSFIEAWENHHSLASVPNLSYQDRGEIRHNPMQPFIDRLDELPFPDFNLLKAKNRKTAGKTVIPMLTSRGCPFNCSFCSVTGMFGRKYRYRSTENIMEEIRRYNSRKNFIFFYDDNFTADRKRAKELLNAMIAEKIRCKWSVQVRADIAKDPELVRLMKKAGCDTLFIGFESIDPQALRDMKKQQTVADITRAVKLLRKNRIHIHGMFVFGFDADDWATVKKTVRFARRSRLTSTQFLILTPLPGSAFYNKISCEKRLMFKDWSLFDAHHVVFQPKRFSLFELQKAQIFGHKKFYSLKETLKKTFRFKWIDLGLAHYARRLNSQWKKKNRNFLKAVRLIAASKNENITMDFRPKISLDR